MHGSRDEVQINFEIPVYFSGLSVQPNRHSISLGEPEPNNSFSRISDESEDDGAGHTPRTPKSCGSMKSSLLMPLLVKISPRKRVLFYEEDDVIYADKEDNPNNQHFFYRMMNIVKIAVPRFLWNAFK